MNYTALTTKYRPQLFAEVAGQKTLKEILSRAALEDKIVPAYLFSGTRGVGKTTLARIFAKAINCRTAPAAEPCNQCDQCRAVTMGTSVDVVEIDGASNRGIDDVRRLKEVVGYAPMEGRYKIFIIDEAHMLSREAFNALLKTLEEPPAGVTFIMATTEPHKFPATIISRCQHYIFKELPEDELINHLALVLSKEGIDFDESALSLIARRGAGSVRDSMSLMGQVLALGEKNLTDKNVRQVLGLAGQEAFEDMLLAIKDNNSLKLVSLVREFLDQGLDIGFFLRELATLWRNLFILKQSGEAGLSAVKIPLEEGKRLLTLSHDFELGHIHASWQMTLEGQRRVQSSLDPGLALELLLLNLALLPQLMPLDALSSLARRSDIPPSPGGKRPGGELAAQEIESHKTDAAPKTNNEALARKDSEASLDSGANFIGQAESSLPDNKIPPDKEILAYSKGAGEASPKNISKDFSGDKFNKSDQTQEIEPENKEHDNPILSDTNLAIRKTADLSDIQGMAKTSSEKVQPSSEQGSSAGSGLSPKADYKPDYEPNYAPYEQNSDPSFEPAYEENYDPAYESNFEADYEAASHPSDGANYYEEEPGYSNPEPHSQGNKTNGLKNADTVLKNEGKNQAPVPEKDEKAQDSGKEKPDWEMVVAQANMRGAPAWFSGLASSMKARWENKTLILIPTNGFAADKVLEGDARKMLDQTLEDILGFVPEIKAEFEESKILDRNSIKEEVSKLDSVQSLEKELGAIILDYGQMRK